MVYVCLFFIFSRPFISRLAFGEIDYYFTSAFSIIAFTHIILNRNKIKPQLIDKFIFLFLFSCISSIFFSSNFSNSINKIPIFISYIIIFYFTRSLDNLNKGLILKTAALSALVLCCYGLYQYFGGFKDIAESLKRNNVFYPFAYEWLSRKRVFALFFSPNAFAGFLIMILPLTYYLKKEIGNRNVFLKVILLIIAFLALTNLILTQSISAIFSLLAAFFLILLTKMGKNKKLFIGFMIILIIFAVIFYLRTQTNKAFTTPSFSLEKRIQYYKEALNIIKQHPFIGIGLGNFKGEHSLFTHNSYLQIWAELGILGIISLLGIVFSVTRSAIKKNSLPLLCAFLAFSIHNLLDFTFFLPEVCWLWWVLAGI